VIFVTHLTLLLGLAAATTIDVPSGASLADALARARPGDVVRLGPGVHAASLGQLAGLRVEGAGSSATRVVAPEGRDGAVVTGRAELSGLSIAAGEARSALKVLDGEARLDDVGLDGAAVGAYVDGGRLEGRDVRIRGAIGLLVRRGDVALRGSQVGGGGGARVGIAVLRGRLSLSRSAVTGPFSEGAVTVSGGSADLAEVVIRDPGPTGISVTIGEVTGRDVEIAGAREVPTPGIRGLDAILGDCVQLIRGKVRLASSGLSRCGGAAISASGGELVLDGVDALGGTAGGLILLDGARAALGGNWIAGNGPGLVAGTGAQVEATFNRWRTDPVFWVECGTGARVRLGVGEHAAEPCAPAR
jgi:hypothetical protein